MKSGKFDTPFDFSPIVTIGENHIQYTDLVEVCQGGPIVGRLSINGDMVSGYDFTGPFLYSDMFIYVPALVKSAFIITQINLRTKEVKFRGKTTDFICLEKIEDNKIYYYDSLTYSNLIFYDISEYQISNISDDTIDVGKNRISYKNITENSSNKVSLGNLFINEKIISGHLYGKPFLYTESNIIAPVYVKRLWKSGFKIAIIDLTNYKVDIIGNIEKSIYLDSVENNKIYYYRDLDKKDRGYLMISRF